MTPVSSGERLAALISIDANAAIDYTWECTLSDLEHHGHCCGMIDRGVGERLWV